MHTRISFAFDSSVANHPLPRTPLYSRDCGASLARIVWRNHPTPSFPAVASEPRNRRTKLESHKHPQERSITNRSGQQYPGEIAACGPAASEGLPGAKTRARGAGRLTESPREKPESELAEKLSKVEKVAQNAVIKEIMAEFGLEGATKKRLGRYHREHRELGSADDWVPTEAGADCRDLTQAKHH